MLAFEPAALDYLPFTNGQVTSFARSRPRETDILCVGTRNLVCVTKNGAHARDENGFTFETPGNKEPGSGIDRVPSPPGGNSQYGLLDSSPHYTSNQGKKMQIEEVDDLTERDAMMAFLQDFAVGYKIGMMTPGFNPRDYLADAVQDAFFLYVQYELRTTVGNC